MQSHRKIPPPHGIAPYLHGYTRREQRRLIDQANLLKGILLQGISFPKGERVLEVGCGVGAHLGILSEKFPALRLVGLDRSLDQLKGAISYLKKSGRRRVALLQADALSLPFPDGCFTGIFTCWFLEHLSDPLPILKECRRVLGAGGSIYLTEVENSSLSIWPESNLFRKFWEAFNHTQLNLKGDPFVGKKLYPLLKATGFGRIQITPITFHYHRGDSHTFTEFVIFFHRICQSALEKIVEQGAMNNAEVQQALREFRSIARHPQGVISFTCYRGVAKR
jgi:ubiquinone/menaquinone biosynthesis C-methylase UbiE